MRPLVCLLIAGLSAPSFAAGDEPPPLLQVGTQSKRFALRPINPKASGVRRFVLAKIVGKRAPAKSRAKLLAVAFYATWCESCQVELPVLNRIAEAHKADGFRAVVIGVDKGADSRDKLKQRMTELGITMPVVHDGANILMRRYNAAELPTLYLIDGTGTIVFAKSGFNIKKRDDKKIARAIAKHLAGG
jgi:thiol-disulfide isomerase/thioredoxin